VKPGKSNPLMVGIAQTDITPEVGALMSCFPLGPERIPRRAKGIHDPIKAKVIAISDGKENIALCSCDLTLIRTIDVERIRKEVEKQAPELSGPRIIITATHTHSSAETTYLFGNTPDNPWVKEIDHIIAETIVQAYKNRTPATLSYGKSPVELTFNRRVSERGGKARLASEYKEGESVGPVDPELIVVRFDREDRTPIAILFNYTAHALTVGPENSLYTADYPGVACSLVEKVFQGTQALFFNGACGDVHPRKCMRRDFKIMEEMGKRLGEEVIKINSQLAWVKKPSLRFKSENLTFSNRADPWQNVKVEISSLLLGEIIIGFIPGELFVEFQLGFKSELKYYTGMIVCYANGWHGYIPTQKDYEIGGYGVDLYATDPPEYSRTSLPRGAGEKIMERLLSLAHSLLSNKDD